MKEPESEESATEAQELLNNLKDSMEQSGGRSYSNRRPHRTEANIPVDADDYVVTWRYT